MLFKKSPILWKYHDRGFDLDTIQLTQPVLRVCHIDTPSQKIVSVTFRVVEVLMIRSWPWQTLTNLIRHRAQKSNEITYHFSML